MFIDLIIKLNKAAGAAKRSVLLPLQLGISTAAGL
jgi:hypothetical protein